MNKVKDKTLLLLSLIGAAAFIFMKFASHRPNRIAQGVSYSGLDFLGALGLIIIFLWAMLMALSFYEGKYKNMSIFILACLLLGSLFWTLQARSGLFTAASSSARISLSSGFYIQIYSLYMIFSTYSRKLKKYKFIKWLGILSVLFMLFYFFITGAFDDLSLVKEYNIKKTQFYENLRIHAILTFGSVLTGSIIAIPLGFLAYSKKKLEDKIMVPLSIIETIPSISLFGILLVPLSALGNLAFFNAIGVSGIGWAPAYVALTLYTLLPIGRNTLTGFYSNYWWGSFGRPSRWWGYGKLCIPRFRRSFF